MKRSTTLLLFLFVLNTALATISEKDSTISISGQILHSESLASIPLATISIKRTRKGTICDSLGVFHLQIQQSDTLIISALGYQPKQWEVPFIFNPDFPPFFTIKLNDISYLLKEIDIYALGTWDEFKEEFLNAKITEKNPINDDIKKQLKPFNTKKPNIVPAQYRPKREGKMGIIGAIFAPTDFLHNKFSKTEKAKKKISKLIREKSKTKKIYKKFNADIISDATGLKGEELIKFMEYCGSKISVNEHSSEYQVMKQILDLYEDYTTKEE